MVEETKKIWMDGELVDWAEAKTHILTHSLHYGLGVFEGIRCYKTDRGSAIFRLMEHVDRLFNSVRIVNLKMNYSKEEIIQAILRTIKVNGLEECYIRPIVYIGYGGMGVSHRGVPVRTAIAVWPWGAYLGEKGLTEGIRVKVSSYTGHHTNVNMTKAKVCGNYANSQLAKMEALDHGYDEAVMLDPEGYVAQGSGENIFIVKRGVVKTPPLSSILEGITRDSVIKLLAQDLNIPAKEELFPRDELYVADEAFFCGTAAEITPIREVDNRPVGEGRPGDLTLRLQKVFFDVVRGRNERHLSWLHFV
ncbi:MAG: branched-chain amino acid transaminase [Candidatus Tectomicrobia bacterium]|uniref:Branched-chain-amino-acid aminotransferase n=1 Tax=Tectimicrobiota bacterium TaxID=2528274 RepID=A0A932CM53_UNCTE|nr:branched-chain amino acid transaminase [Candidatus Tectomicrobia bacterium]